MIHTVIAVLTGMQRARLACPAGPILSLVARENVGIIWHCQNDGRITSASESS